MAHRDIHIALRELIHEVQKLHPNTMDEAQLDQIIALVNELKQLS